MRRALLAAGTMALMLSSPTQTHAQQTIRFDTDPFAGTAALVTPGRQVIGNELFTSFNVATDRFVFDPAVFNIGSSIKFANGLIGSIPASGLNVVVLQTLDNDGDPLTPFGAGTAANLLASQITTPGAGLFIYFNSGLNLPRLVFSTDLSDNTADLKVLARFTDFAGDPGALPTFTESNFAVVPEPSSFLLVAAGGALLLVGRAKRRA